ncbi:MAG: hypothetical protein E7242_10650 [Lachnospiraceae bacterium]|nr:hypothetical protein [Lachnospiraceae bacterium]
MGLKMYEKQPMSKVERFKQYLTMRGWKNVLADEEKEMVIIPYDDINVYVSFDVDNYHPEKANLCTKLGKSIVKESFKNDDTDEFDERQALDYINTMNLSITGLKAVLLDEKAIFFQLILQYPENMLFQHVESYISIFHDTIADYLFE